MNRVIIGIGSSINQDDNIGNIVAERLGGVVGATAPENYMPHNADEIILVDAVIFGGKPGDVKAFSPEDMQGFLHSTHNLPIDLFKKFNPNAKIRVIAIQPKDTDFGESLSPELAAKLDDIVAQARKLI